MSEDPQKKKAAEKAAEYVKDGMVVGLGTGSTTYYFIHRVAQLAKEGLNFKAVSSSFSTTLLAKDLGIHLIEVENTPTIDLYVDGTDEIDPAKNLIKGRGGAMVKEKLLASIASQFIVIADKTKHVQNLGNIFPVPVEVLPFAWRYVSNELTKLGGTPTIRMAKQKDGPVISDWGNFILDVKFPGISGPKKLDQDINNISGVVGHGIFCNLATQAIIAGGNGLHCF